MKTSLIALAALPLALGALALPGPALARGHGHIASIQGAHGRGVTQARWVTRSPGAVNASRSVQTNGGRGYAASRSRACTTGACSGSRALQTNDGRGATQSRSAAWGDGSYTGSRSTIANNGNSYGRTTSATNNGDGTANYSTTLTGPNGMRTVSGTVARP